MSRYKVGDQVRMLRQLDNPTTGTNTAGYGKSVGTVGYINFVRGDGVSYHVYTENEDYAGFFTDQELELVTTKQGEKVMRKTYKLIKDTPWASKGGIFQEACDDWTQEFVLLTPEHDNQSDVSGDLKIHRRSLVENNPKWFVEVFQVEPQYMTREELDQWEAFKNGKRQRSTVKAHTATKHQAHAKKQGPAVYRRGRSCLSAGRMTQFLEASKHSRSDKAIALKLKVKVGTVHVYRSIARHNGLI